MKRTHSPAFREGVLNPLVRGEILVPPLRTYLSDPNFGGLTITIPEMGKRPHDGWFHPSEHPTWSERALFVYLTAPALLVPRMFEAQDVLAMTAGSIWHAVIQHCLTELGLVTGVEVPIEHATTNARGRTDGMRYGEVVEIKTMKDVILRKIDSPETYIERYPGYYAQAQEYMRMSGLPVERVLLIAVTYPFEMKEFVIPHDMAYTQEVEQRYRRAIQASADGQVPMCGACDESCPVFEMCKAMSGDQITDLIYGDKWRTP